MTRSEANAEAHRWVGFARALARRSPRPPTYTREDWEAEGLFGLAKGLLRLDPRGPRATYAPFLRRVIRDHLSTARKDAYRAPAPGHESRARWAEVISMDEEATRTDDDGEALQRHETVPDPLSPNPYEEAVRADIVRELRAYAAVTTPVLRTHLALLAAGVERDEAARRLGVSANAVSGARKRLRADLRARLEPLGYAA